MSDVRTPDRRSSAACQPAPDLAHAAVGAHRKKYSAATIPSLALDVLAIGNAAFLRDQARRGAPVPTTSLHQQEGVVGIGRNAQQHRERPPARRDGKPVNPGASPLAGCSIRVLADPSIGDPLQFDPASSVMDDLQPRRRRAREGADAWIVALQGPGAIPWTRRHALSTFARRVRSAGGPGRCGQRQTHRQSEESVRFASQPRFERTEAPLRPGDGLAARHSGDARHLVSHVLAAGTLGAGHGEFLALPGSTFKKGMVVVGTVSGVPVRMSVASISAAKTLSRVVPTFRIWKTKAQWPAAPPSLRAVTWTFARLATRVCASATLVIGAMMPAPSSTAKNRSIPSASLLSAYPGQNPGHADAASSGITIRNDVFQWVVARSTEPKFKYFRILPGVLPRSLSAPGKSPAPFVRLLWHTCSLGSCRDSSRLGTAGATERTTIGRRAITALSASAEPMT